MVKSVYTTHEISKICYVYPTTVINWIKEGKLSCYTTPGGHRRVRKDDLIQFLKKYRIPLPSFLENNGKIKILVVDDEPDILELVRKTLATEEALEIECVSTGFGAGVKICEWHPNLIILDFLMPDLDGFEVCKLLKANPSTKDIPIIALTCLRQEEDKKRIKECGVADYIAKPFKCEELLKTVKNHLLAERII